ncbi:MAG: conjugal transfer protein TraX [Oscillospiraceae bacterium]|nr:conjugal transfer protein TraX [Oscillospiraceae bacterium]
MLNTTPIDRLKLIDRDMLKWTALFFMGIGHFFVYTARDFHFFGLPTPILRFFLMMEYFAPPVFFFFISEGYRYTHSKKKYFIRLLIMTLVTQIPYVLYHTYALHHTISFDILMFFTDWNVIATLILGFISLVIWDSSKHPAFKAAGIILCCAAGYFTEWSFFGVLFILLFYIFRERPLIRFAAYELLTALYLIRGWNWIFFAVFSLPNITIALFYNGEKGRSPKFSKYFFYFFYPAHLLLIYLVIILFKA